LNATPTAPDRPFRLGGFATLTEALDFAAGGPTGVNLYGMRGELVAAMPYAELRDRAKALAARLLAAGLTTHDRVGLVAETDADFVTAFFACQYARLTPAPLPRWAAARPMWSRSPACWARPRPPPCSGPRA